MPLLTPTPSQSPSDRNTPIGNEALAYLGDAVIEVFVRNALVMAGIIRSGKLTEASRAFVTAPAQARAAALILPHLTEEEAEVFRHARNMGHTGIPKGATASEYRTATGLEALFGRLFLDGKSERAEELFCIAYADKLALLKSNK